MATRQRHVYPTDNIAHLWAHQTQDSARNPAGNFYFTGDTIYSYGGHFPIARLVERKGKRAVFFTTRAYSITTAKHKRIARYACRHLTVFLCDPRCSPKGARSEFLTRVQRAYAELMASKNKIQRWRRFEALTAEIQRANEFFEFFGYRVRCKLSAFFSRAELDALAMNVNECQAAKRERDAKKAERRAEQRRKWREEEACKEAEFTAKQPELIERWRNGESLDWWITAKLPTLLRINGDCVETSKGVEFPLEHAKRALPVVKALLDNGRTYQRNGHTIHLGHYALDRIDEQGTIYAGCHVVPREEVERMIAALNGSPVSVGS